MQGLQGYELGLGDCMAIKASMGLVVKDFLARSTVATRDVDALHDGYKLVTSKPNSRVYTRRAAHPSLKECLTIGRTTDMSLEDFSYLSYSDTTEQFKSDQAIFYEHNFHDAAVLTNVHKKTNDDPFLYFGVKYKRLSIPSSGLAEVRDTVFFEVMCAKCVVPVPRAIKTNSPPACAKEDFCKRCFVEAQTGRVPSASASRNSGEFGKSSLTSNDVEGSNLTSTTTQDELFETYVTTCNAIVKPGMFSKEGTASASSSAATSLTSTSTPLSSRDPSLDSAAAAFTQLQVSIEQQKALVSQMQQRLESRSHVG
ncbi:hypothetical protein DYB32_008619 [Aphanomyces invadans]|uniref:Uncharacterized protein n=1 Tax=Aphanomyces invadans TaxID=157072 RepID=A0A3R7CV66_9STRA|nr:hypothetical protein DYB32_008619 [Aphanomyces invadans]